MAKLDLRLRDLNTGDTVNAMFESEHDAEAWLADRPRFTQVLGVATHGLPEAIYKTLRAAVRPLDAEEDGLRRGLEERAEAAAREAAMQEQLLEELEMKRHREAMRTADPHRPMNIEWSVDGGMRIADPVDPREIPEVVRDAVLAWVAVRDGWMADREQRVGEANVTVWPGPVPTGEERIHPGGQFFPAPK